MDSPIYESIENIRRLIGEAGNNLFNALQQDDVDLKSLCSAMVELNSLKKDIGYIHDESNTRFAEKMEDSVIFLEDGTEIERKQGADRKAWNHKGLAVEVAAKISQLAINMDTGEITLTPDEMMVKMFDYAAPSYWRVGELGKLGVNVDNYCEKSEGKTSIVIKKGKL